MDIESAQLVKFSKGIPTVMNNLKHKKTKIIYIQDEDIRKSINLLDMKKKNNEKLQHILKSHLVVSAFYTKNIL